MAFTGTELLMNADRIAQLEAENAKLRDRVGYLERQTGALMVDADRREERALRQAGSCEYHGHEIQHLRHMANWCWADASRQNGARGAIVAQLALASSGRDFVVLGKGTAERRIPVPGELAQWLGKCIDAQNKHMREPGFPTFADCQRAGGCDHPALSPSLSDEVRKQRRPRAQPAAQALFGEDGS